MASVSEATRPRATMSFDLTLFIDNAPGDGHEPDPTTGRLIAQLYPKSVARRLRAPEEPRFRGLERFHHGGVLFTQRCARGCTHPTCAYLLVATATCRTDTTRLLCTRLRQ